MNFLSNYVRNNNIPFTRSNGIDSTTDNSSKSNINDGNHRNLFLLVLPVLFLEYLAISLTKSLIPTMLLETFGDWSYIVIGCMETFKGLTAFLACPIFGKISDNSINILKYLDQVQNLRADQK